MSRILNPLRYILPAVQQIWTGTSTTYAPGSSQKNDVLDFEIGKKPLSVGLSPGLSLGLPLMPLSLSASPPHSLHSPPPLPHKPHQ